MLTACRTIMTEDASIIAAERPSDTTETSELFADHARDLRVAAADAGFSRSLATHGPTGPRGSPPAASVRSIVGRCRPCRLRRLSHVLQIVAISASGAGDQFLYYATETEAAHAVRHAAATPERQVSHVDLLVFHTLGGSS